MSDLHELKHDLINVDFCSIFSYIKQAENAINYEDDIDKLKKELSGKIKSINHVIETRKKTLSNYDGMCHTFYFFSDNIVVLIKKNGDFHKILFDKKLSRLDYLNKICEHFKIDDIDNKLILIEDSFEKSCVRL